MHLPERLVNIFSRCKYVDKIITQFPDPLDYDRHITLWDLPLIFNISMKSVPREIPYFYADPMLVNTWKIKLKEDKNFKIGICWSGSGACENYRDVPLHMFSSIAKIPGISLYSLQKIRDCEQIKTIDFNIHDFGNDFDEENGAFSDTAAIMKVIDLVITVDTSVAHLAGALGVPVWVIIPFAPDWRWFLHRSDSPWYATMRLFRGKKRYEWESVIEEICKELKKNYLSSEFLFANMKKENVVI